MDGRADPCLQVLFCPGWVAAIFSIAAVACLGYQYYELFVVPTQARSEPVKLDQPQPKTVPSIVSHEPDIEEAFKLAKAAAAAKAATLSPSGPAP